MKTLTSRRDVILGAGALAASSSLPAFIHSALAQDNAELADILKGLKPVALNIPPVTFKIGQNACTGPWGEVQVVRFGAMALPYRVRSANQLGLIEMGARRPFVQLGVGRADAITFSSLGVSFAPGLKLEPWSAATARKLREAIRTDRHKTRALMQLRSTLLSAYPVFLDSSNTLTAPQTAMELERTSSGMTRTTCTTEERVELVDRFETEVLEIWDTAAEQYDRCFAHETSGDEDLACSYLPAGHARNACATTVCGVKEFVDVLVDTIEVVTRITEAVVTEVVVCTSLAVKNALINTWSLVDQGFPLFGGKAPTRAIIATVKDKQAALDALREAAASLGPLAKALIQARWEVQERQTEVLADGTRVLVHDVKVFVASSSVATLTASAVAAEFAATQVLLIALLAAVHAGFAAAAAAWGVLVPSALTAAAALSVLSAGAATIFAVMVAMIALVLVHGPMIAAQIDTLKQVGQLEGELQIRHATLTIEQLRSELDYLRTRAQALQQAKEDLFQPPVVVG